jgi:PAS domain S-box-containing protein
MVVWSLPPKEPMLPSVNRSWRDSLTGRTLLQIAAAAGLGIVLATGVTYYVIYDAMEAMGLQLLTQYATERAKREEAPFLLAEANHRLFKEAFMARWLGPPDASYPERFEAHFSRTADGALRSRRELVDPMRQPSTWIRAGTPASPELKRLVMLSHDLCEQFFPAWREQIVDLYVTSPMQFNSGIAPGLPEWVWDIAADFDQTQHEWVRVVSLEANPDRRQVWTGVLLDISNPDPATRLPFVALCTPVDVNGRHLLTVHNDIELEGLLTGALRSERAGITHVIFRQDGLLIAQPGKRGEIISKEGRLFIQQSNDTDLKSIHAAVSGRTEAFFSGYDPGSRHYFAASRLQGPGWFFVSLMPRAELRQQAFQSAQWVLWAGVASLGFVLATLALILRQQVARPLRNLLRATRRVAAGEPGSELSVDRHDELGELADAFNQMARNVAAREADILRLNRGLEQRVHERTAELTASEARIRTMLENAPEAIVVLDGNTGQFVDANENALRFFQLDRERLLRSSPVELSPERQPDGRPSEELAREKIQAALEGGTPVFAWTHRSAQGSEIPCEVRLCRLPASDRDLVIGTILDITERKQGEEQLLKALAQERELSELKSNFITLVSHEYRTPLGIIISSADILERYFDRLDPTQRARHLGAVRDAVKRMAGMMEEVLLLGRFEADRLSCKPDDLHLTAWCRRLVDEMRSATADACPIELHLADFDPMARADENLLRHILSNLLANAVKYSPPGVPVHLRVSRENGDAVFSVEDRGIGIPPEDRPRLFETFHRARNAGHISGTGLGLVIVKRCVDLHGGRIEFISTVGEGSTFTVRLPLFEQTSQLHN